MDYVVREENSFKYLEEGEGPILMLLHGLFGALSNFRHILQHFTKDFKVVVPLLPIYELPLLESSVTGLVRYVERFVQYKNYNDISVLGNSLGGHIALLYALKNPSKLRSMILTGSSGLFESSLGGSFPKRGSYQFIKQKTEYTFYDPSTATKELVDEVYEIVNNRNKALRIIQIAKNAIKHNVGKELHKIKVPTLLIWGKNDNITPPHVGEEFKKLIGNAELKFIDFCGHAPMMEHPAVFNKMLENFLSKLFTYKL